MKKPDWVLLSFLGGTGVLMMFICGGMLGTYLNFGGKKTTTIPTVKANTIKSPLNPEKEPDLQPVSLAKEYQFGEEVRDGDLLITVVEVSNNGPFAGQYYGQFRSMNATLVHIRVKNTSPGKIAEWAGWHGKGEIEDEHGNNFKPISLSGWEWLPNNMPNSWSGDFSTRIFPGKTYDNAAYYQTIPTTSKQATVRLPFKGQTVKYRGLLGNKKEMDHAKALAAKRGQILQAADLIRDITADSKTLTTDYPIGCTMQVTGTVYVKGGTRSDLAEHLGAYEILLKCKDGREAICYTDDRALYNRVVSVRGVFDKPVPKEPAVGSVVTLQGIFHSLTNAKKIQISISKATEVSKP